MCHCGCVHLNTTANSRLFGEPLLLFPLKKDEEVRSAPAQLLTSLSPEEQERLAQQNAQRHDWTLALGAQDRRVTGRTYQRLADLQVSATDPDATLMQTKHGVDLGYHTRLSR